MSNLLKYEVFTLVSVKSMPAYAQLSGSSLKMNLWEINPLDLLKNGEAQKGF